MATPGQTATHQAVTRSSLPLAIISPQAGLGRGMPAPRKLKVASKRITCPTSRVARTMMVFITLGKICLRMILAFEAPATFARATKSRFFRLRVSPRTSRAYLDQNMETMTIITV